MKSLLMLIVLLIFVSFFPSVVQADGKGRSQRKAIPCSKLKAKARQKCEARQAAAAAAAARRRAEEARRRAVAAENALRKTAASNIARDNTDGEDLAIRKAVVEAIGNNAATAVVMETQTGEIKTIVNQDWAIRKSFPPCSTIKLVTTIAGLNEGVIDEEDEASQEDLLNSIARSRNPYFQKIGSSVGYPKLIATAKVLGLGKPTGINALGESSGKLPLVQKTALVYSHGYGFEITPLQQVVMVSIIANHGKKVTPYIPRKAGKTPDVTPNIEQVSLPVKDLDGAIPGMKGAAEFGTARNGVDFSQGVAGKTGTCSATGTFTSVAPIDNPKYTVVVVIRGNYGKGKYAAAIAGKIYQHLFRGKETVLTEEKPKQPEPDIIN